MLRTRHTSTRRYADEPAVRGYAVRHPPGQARLPIEPGWDQLLYVEYGSMTVLTLGASWTVPVRRALWIPDNARATVVNRTAVAVRALYFDSTLGLLGDEPTGVRAVNLSGLVRALLLHAVHACPLRLEEPVHAGLVTVLADQLRSRSDEPLRLPWPVEPRAVDAANHIVADASADLTAVARRVGASRRTLERAFAAETGLSLGAWRRRALILSSLHDLASGISVNRTALSAGYATASAYVAAFKRELGTTPHQYLRP